MARKKLKEETLIPEQEEVQEETVIPEPLQTFMELYKNNDKSVVPHAIGVEIWKCWQRYVKRTDVWRGCSSCLISKIRFLKKELKKYGIEL